jgi:hypothetical protein
LLEELPKPRPGIGKQDAMDEIDRRSRAFDVEQNGADRLLNKTYGHEPGTAVRLGTVEDGRYDGPRQTGS